MTRLPMIRPLTTGLAGVAGVCLLLAGPVLGQAEADARRFEIRLVGPAGEDGVALRQAVSDDLSRTPRGFGITMVAEHSFPADFDVTGLLAVVEIGLEPGLARPRLEPARAGDLLTPGWLVHAVLRAGATVGVEVDYVDPRASWIAQLVRRSTREEPRAADSALAIGVPAVRLLVPGADAASSRLLAASVRRLGGLEGPPVFEDVFLVLGGRVLVRRDLYWIGLVLWLALFWRGRGKSGGELRWLLLAAWLVAPAYAVVLLSLPAVVAAWRPQHRWPAAVALLPVAAFGVGLVRAIAGPARMAVSGLPVLLVVLALAAFAWHYLIRRRPEAARDDDGRAAATSDGEPANDKPTTTNPEPS